MSGRLSAVRTITSDVAASATLSVDTLGESFTDITEEARRFLRDAQAGDGALLMFLRHTSASLVIQENADPDVQADLISALRRVAPSDAGWIHDAEGPDDMPAHVKAMLTGVSLHIPVETGALGLGTWQAIYLVEHRARPHRREIVMQFIGNRR